VSGLSASETSGSITNRTHLQNSGSLEKAEQEHCLFKSTYAQTAVVALFDRVQRSVPSGLSAFRDP